MTALAPELALSTPVNRRDLAGIPIAGGRIRAGFVVRADDLSLITTHDADELVTAGVTAVIDLRSAFEVALTGCGVLSQRRVTYHHVSLMPDLGRSGSTVHGPTSSVARTYESMGYAYADMVDRSAAEIVTALGIIAHAPGATAFRCAAGRDRTGVLAAMLLLALGASDEDIVADYARTDENLAAIDTVSSNKTLCQFIDGCPRSPPRGFGSRRSERNGVSRVAYRGPTLRSLFAPSRRRAGMLVLAFVGEGDDSWVPADQRVVPLRGMDALPAVVERLVATGAV